MFGFAFRNLKSRPLRTALSLVGMAVAIVLIVGLISCSQGIRKLIKESLGQVDGLVVVLKENPDLMLSKVDESYGARLQEVRGVKVASPEIWTAAAQIEGNFAFFKGTESYKYAVAVVGVDPAVASKIERSAIFRRALVAGDYLPEGDPDAALISKEVADQFKKEVGDSFQAAGHEFRVVGIFQTGSMFFDRVLVTHIDTAREIRGIEKGQVSAFFIEPENAEDLPEVERRIENEFPELTAHTPEEMSAYASSWLERLDVFLLVITVLPIVGGAVAILNTMLMSFNERIKEFGVMRACGWTRGNLVHLVLCESAYLGLLGGVLGILLGYGGTHIVGALLAVEPVTPLWLPATCLALSTILGMAGGTYPAYKAVRMDPIRAIKYE
ncbi:MAG: ABC transporter permease [Planctomycetes bacterium]|nr:ABC transporter permease [Planctomycetota bacterium]